MLRPNPPEFINKHEISRHLYCIICMQVFKSPVRAPCGHTFCLVCIENWVNRSKKQCPICKQRVSSRKLEKDLLGTKLVDDLKVKCSNKGCKWQGAYSDLRSHKKDCQYTIRKNVEIPPDTITIQVDDQIKPTKRLDIINLEENP